MSDRRTLPQLPTLVGLKTQFSFFFFFFFSLFLLENLNVNKSNIVNFTHQNAEDNEYGEDVNPSLELVITSKDITGTGALMTLLIFNNEKGFSAKNIESICGVGRSTKKGNRKRGYIGEKGTFIS